MKVLLVQTSFLGDTILSTPVIRALKGLYPNSELWMMTTPLAKPVVERDPLLQGVLVFDKRGVDRGVSGLIRQARSLRSVGIDCVYSLHRSFRTALLLRLSGIPYRVGFCDAKGWWWYHRRIARPKEQHDAMRNLSLLASELDVSQVDQELRVFPPAEDEVSLAVVSAFADLNQEPVVLVPGSAWKTKMWKWQGYREVAQHFESRGIPVVVIGSTQETAVAQMVSEGTQAMNLAGKTTVADVIYMISKARLVVCNDSMALHLASALKIPTVAVFCATSPTFGFGPWRNRAVVVEHKGLWCKPCRRHGSQRCPTGTESCMKDVSSQEVIHAAEILLTKGEGLRQKHESAR